MAIATDFPSPQRANARLVAARRWHPDQDTSELEQDVVTARLAAYARKITGDAPELSQDRLDALMEIIRRGGRK